MRRRRLAALLLPLLVLAPTGAGPVGAAAPLRAATAAPAAAPAVRAGQPAWVRVAVARLWQSPDAPRAVDRPALDYPVHVRRWLAAMTLGQRRALSEHSDTEALLGERVRVLRVRGSWARVVVPDQPSPKARGGYPGWVPVRQLTPLAPAPTARVVTVVARTAWLHRDTAAAPATLEVSSGTTLPYAGPAGRFARVLLPEGVRRIAAAAVVVHARGRPALPGPDLLRTAKRYLGLPYLWGGLSGFGMDCSGLTWLAHRLHGVRIPRDALPQSRAGTPVRRTALRPGDLLFYATRGLVHHVTMYAGGGRMIEAPHTGAAVRIVPVRARGYWGARRY
jgi:cell wall-associated NlpC family hydrolase